MKKVISRIRTLFIVCLSLSIGFPIGVLCIIFGAVKWIVPLLVIGIILTVAGFYVMPILWTVYAGARHDKNILLMIENSYIYTVSGIAAQTGYQENDVRERIKRMIINHELTGYIFQDDTLYLNTNLRQTESTSRKTSVCERCGATMIFDGIKYRCEYCGSISDAE